MNKVRKFLWNLISIICIFGYFYFLIKEDIHTANFMLVIALISDNRIDIIKLKEKNDVD